MGSFRPGRKIVNKLGMIINNLGSSQLAFGAINSGNQFVKQEERSDFILFYYELAPECAKPEFMVCNLAEAMNYNGSLIATNLNSAARILEFPGTQSKYWYCWDLDWLRMQNRDYDELRKVYESPRLKLIARSERHAKIIRNAWRDPVGIVENANVQQLWNVVKQNEAEKCL